MIREHLAYMKRRMDSGAVVRRWDRAFVEMTHHHPDIGVKAKELDHGVRVRVTGKTSGAVAVARNRAGIISKFPRKGMDELQRTPPRRWTDPVARWVRAR